MLGLKKRKNLSDHPVTIFSSGLVLVRERTDYEQTINIIDFKSTQIFCPAGDLSTESYRSFNVLPASRFV